MRHPLILLLLAVAVFGAFGGALFHGFAVLDDHHLIVENLGVRQFSWWSVQWFFTHFDPELYIPLTWTTYMLEHALWGLRPAFFHADQLVLHTINAWLVFLLLRRIGASSVASIIGALLFALHPLQTEAVVWLSARKDVLASFFGLLCALSVIREPRESTSHKSILGASIFYALGLLSKISIVGLPIALGALLHARSSSRSDILRRLWPLLGLSALFGFVALLGKADVLSSGMTAPWHRLVYAGIGMASISARIVLPIGLTPFYVAPPLSAGWITIGALGILLPLAWIIWFWRRIPLAAAGMMWWCVCVGVALLNTQTDLRSAGGTFAADRYAYLGFVGLVICVVAVLQKRPVPLSRTVTGAVWSCVLVGCVLLSHRQTSTWQDAHSLLQHALAAAPRSIHARITYASILRAQNQLDEAFSVLKDGLAYGNDPRLHLAAGQTYAQAGQLQEAAEQFRLMQQLEPSSPEAVYALGQLAEHDGDLPAALSLYRESLSREPQFAAAHRAIARVHTVQGNVSDAESELRRAIDIEPFDRETLLQFHSLLQTMGRQAEADALSERIKRLNPYQE